MSLERDDAEDEREEPHREHSGRCRKPDVPERPHPAGDLGQPVPGHEVRDGPLAVAGGVGRGILELEGEPDEIGASAEVDGVAEAQNAGEAPDEIQAEREHHVAEEEAELVRSEGTSVERKDEEAGDHREGDDQLAAGESGEADHRFSVRRC